MAFESMYLEEDIHIDRIYTIHYFEYKSDFHFAGERHNFWEFQCVDKGKAEIETDNGIYHLTSGQLIFHRPNHRCCVRQGKRAEASEYGGLLLHGYLLLSGRSYGC